MRQDTFEIAAARPSYITLAFEAALIHQLDVRAKYAVERDIWVSVCWARLIGVSPASKLCALKLMEVIK